ncbi:hypothetical protein Nmel_007668, partial [Mimus melanotis]
MNWKTKSNKLAVQKREYNNLEENCNSEIFHWSKSKQVVVSIFLPWVAAAKALGELGHLECWVEKQTNLTSATLSDFLEDEETTRKATLQNRAAIDFLLLAYGHGCEEFEGLCCFNLSSRSSSIHSRIQQLHQLIGNIKKESEDWLDSTLKSWGLTGWLASVIKTLLWIVFIIILLIIALSILKVIILRSISS